MKEKKVEWILFLIDINECASRVCRADQRCRNTDGGYRCIDDCPTGMEKTRFKVCVGANVKLTFVRFIETAAFSCRVPTRYWKYWISKLIFKTLKKYWI